MENTTAWLTNEISSTEISRKTSQDAHAARVARSAGAAGVAANFRGQLILRQRLCWNTDNRPAMYQQRH
jgi:hypothetical protein